AEGRFLSRPSLQLLLRLTRLTGILLPRLVLAGLARIILVRVHRLLLVGPILWRLIRIIPAGILLLVGGVGLVLRHGVAPGYPFPGWLEEPPTGCLGRLLSIWHAQRSIGGGQLAFFRVKCGRKRAIRLLEMVRAVAPPMPIRG